MEGIIFDIIEFAVFDGPGIRKTVFFKGCPLNCVWCHNPEGISPKRELMVNYSSCKHCGRCDNLCTAEECDACGRCIHVCPLRLRRICGTGVCAKDLSTELKKDQAFFEKNKGGITLSGGEPLMQPQFLLELLQNLKPMHTAMETCGYASREVFQRAVSLLDLVMFDIKHMDPVEHMRLTGKDNAPILDNLEYLCQGETPFIVRLPMIPGINDSIQNITQVAEFLKDAKNLVSVELMPYHTTAGAKYAMLNKKYQPIFDEKKQPYLHIDIFDRYGIRSKIL